MKWVYTKKTDSPLNYSCGDTAPIFEQRSLLSEFVEAGVVSESDVVHFDEVPPNVPYVFCVTYRCHVAFIGHSSAAANPMSKHDFLVKHFMWLADNTRLITDMREGRALLLITDHWEAHESVNDFVEGFSAFALTLGVPAKSMMFMDDNVAAHQVTTHDSIRYGTAHFFESKAHRFIRPAVSPSRLNILVHPISKQKRFLSYNRHWNSYRQFAVFEYVARGLSAHGLISCSTHVDDENRIQDALIMREALHSWTADPDKYAQEDLARFANLLPLIIDTQLGDNLAESFKLSHYLLTDFSVVNETWADDRRVFITEKLYKAMFAKHPFILFGNPGTLEYLRSQGYRTFPFMFDESYDTIKDIRLRKDVIIGAIAKWCALPPSKRHELLREAAAVTQHNFEVLTSRSDVQFQAAVDHIRAAMHENTLTLGQINR